MTVAVVNTSSLKKYPDLIEKLKSVSEIDYVTVDKDISPMELSKRLEDAEYIITGITPTYTREFFENAKNLKFLVRQGIGYNNVDVVAAKEFNVEVGNVPGFVEKEDVAEHAVALLMALAKKSIISSQSVLNGEWSVKRDRFFGTRLNKKKIGILGFGNVGKTFARMMKYGFECEIYAYDPYISEELIHEWGAEKKDLDEVLSLCDVISLHINLTDDNYHLINEEKLKLMKPGAFLINTARGELVDEKAIVESLKNNTLGGYGCDVIENEPIKMDNVLLTSPNVIITPHTAVYNKECNFKMCESTVNDVINVSFGNEPINSLTKRI